MTTIAEDAVQLRDLKLEAKRLTAKADSAKSAATQAEQLFQARMESEDIGSIKVDGTLFSPTGTIYGQVQDREMFVAWAQENAPELIEYKERAQLVNELVRERLDTGEELPDGLGFYVKEYVSLRVG